MLGTGKVHLNSKETTLQKVKDALDKSTKEGLGTDKLKLLTFSPLSKRFDYQAPRVFINANKIQKILHIEMELDNKDIKTVVLDTSTKVLVQTNNIITSVLVGALPSISGNRCRIGYLEDTSVDKDKLNITFVKFNKIYDPIQEQLKKDNAKKDKERDNPKVQLTDAKKRGRKKIEKVEVPPNVFRLETHDGSLFVYDNIIVK